MLWLNSFSDALARPYGWVQLVALAAVLLLTFVVRFVARRWLARLAKRTQLKSVRSLCASASQAWVVLTPLLAMLLAAIAHSALENARLDATVFEPTYRVLTVWAAIAAIIQLVESTALQALWIVVLGIGFALDTVGMWRPFVKSTKAIALHMGDIKITLYGLLSSVVALAVLLWVSRKLNTLISRILHRMTMLGSTRQLLLKTMSVVLYCVVGLVAMSILGIDITTLAVFGGALGVGIGFGLQKIASNFISGIILLLEKSVEVDDLIDIGGGVTGFVRHTGARYTLVQVADGRAVLVPNEDFITQRVTNLTFSNQKARLSVSVGIAYDADLATAKQLMLEAANNHPRCIHDPAPNCFVTALGDSSIQLVLYFWVGDVQEGALGPQSDVMEAILTSFRTHGIKIPYPQREMHVVKDA